MSSTETVALVLMMRNEAPSIQKTIESAREVASVDCVVLLDTGSTDETIAIARRTCDEVGIPLHLYEEPFRDYGATRTRLLELSRPHADWQLMLSGDETLVGGIGLILPNRVLPNHDAANVTVRLGSTVYRHPRLTRSSVAWRYVGRTHESLQHPDGAPRISEIPFIEIHHVVKGDQTAKWRRDEALLSEDFRDDDQNPRTQFYLAQTYDCLGDAGRAARFFRLRADNNERGWFAERYEALIRLSKLEPRDEIEHLTRAAEMCPRWLDAWTLLAEAHERRKRRTSAHLAARRATKCRAFKPWESQLLFDRPRLEQRRWELVAIHAHAADEHRDGRAANLECMIRDTMEPCWRKNMKWYPDDPDVKHAELVMVTGMGRSGTSLVTRMIEQLGVTVPRISVVAPDEHNVEGYVEDANILLYLVEKDFVGLANYLTAAAERFASPVAFKAPRFVDHWQEIPWPDCRIHFVIMQRDVEAAARSYVKAYGGEMRRAKTFLANRWEAGEALRESATIRHGWTATVIDYDELVNDPDGWALNLSNVLGLEDESGVERAAKLVRRPT